MNKSSSCARSQTGCNLCLGGTIFHNLAVVNATHNLRAEAFPHILFFVNGEQDLDNFFRSILLQIHLRRK